MTSYLPKDMNEWMRRQEQRISILERRRPTPLQSGSGFIQELASGTDLNDIITSGVYSQQQSAEATEALNYPRGQAGLLRVHTAYSSIGNVNMIWQFYTVYKGNAERQDYERGYYNGSWSPWQEIMVTINSDVTFPGRILLSNGALMRTGGTGISGFVIEDNAGGFISHYLSGTDPIFRATAVWDTTGTGTNVVVASGGYLRRSSSIRASKLEIEDAPEDWSEKIYDLRPVTYLDKGNTERYADLLTKETEGEEIDWSDTDVSQIDTRYPGLIAEEVIEAGMAEFATYDNDGNPVSLAYDRLVAALIGTVKKQRDQINDLSTRLDKAGL